MDTFGGHALVCAAHRDRTVRHYILRDQIAEKALEAGLMPEIEKVGLLPAWMTEDGAPMRAKRIAGCHELRNPPRRTPQNEGGNVLDLACTSGLRWDVWQQAIKDPAGVLSAYAEQKCSYLSSKESAGQIALTFWDHRSP